MRNRLALLALLALAWCTSTGAVGACGLFRPATPEGGAGGIFIVTNYSDPDSTLDTMSKGIAAKAQGNGTEAYLGGLATTADGAAFQATFDPAVLATVPPASRPTSWGIDEERRFYAGFITLRSSAFTMTWDPDTTRNDVVEASHQILYRRYTVYALPSEGDAERIAIGIADLEFILNPSGRWVITGWVDHVDPLIGASPQNQEDRSFSARRLENR